MESASKPVTHLDVFVQESSKEKIVLKVRYVSQFLPVYLSSVPGSHFRF